MDKKPEWLKKKVNLNNNNISELENLINHSNLHTVCQSAKCPNIFECFSKKTATFMLMGDICTRNCGFCGVNSGKPEKLDLEEPFKVASAIKEMALKYAVLTSVTRDDLSDGGAVHFASTVKAIKKISPDVKIECLIPDFRSDVNNLATLLNENPDVLNHNIETIKRNYGLVRKGADYKKSLNIIKSTKEMRPDIFTKSGFMVGLGETLEEITELFYDLNGSLCDIVTIGQYLRPSIDNVKVSKYYNPEEFEQLKKLGESIGFKAVVSGIYVRSSYSAGIVFGNISHNS